MKKYAVLLILFSMILLCLVSIPVLAQDNGANVSVNVVKMEEKASLFTVIVLAITFVILLVFVLYLLKYISEQQLKRRALHEKVRIDIDDKVDIDEREYHEEHESHSDLSMDTEVDKYLKEDEKAVINILRQRGGVTTQSTIRIAGNFPKATLSRILKELEERNVLKKEKRGKKNLVILK